MPTPCLPCWHRCEHGIVATELNRGELNRGRPMVRRAVACAALLAALAGGYFAAHQHRSEPPQTARLNQIQLPDIDRRLRSGDEWLGKVVVVNHWATWCPPCLGEIPILIEYQARRGEQGVQVVGIAHDLLDDTRIFSDQVGLNYPSLVVLSGGGELIHAQGGPRSGVLPFTAIFDRQGNLAASFLGTVNWQQLDAATLPLL